MTEDYKKNLLDYVTGNLQEGTPTADEIIKEVIEVERSKWVGYFPNGWDAFRIEGLIKSKTNDTIILYGGYKEYSTSNPYGLIILIDNNFNPIKTFYSFSNGTRLRYIQCMNQADDGTFYYLDDSIYSYNDPVGVLTSQKRFVMVNNFSSSIDGTYVLNLRTSYILGDDYKNIYCHKIEKNINGSQYVMLGSREIERTNTFVGIRAIELKINVGMPNDWMKIDTGEENENLIHYGGSFIQFSGDKASYKILGDKLGDYGTFCLSKGYNDNSFTQTLIYNSPGYNDDLIDSDYYSNQCVFLNQNEVYFTLTNQHQTWNGQPENKHISLMYYNFSTNTADVIYDEALGQEIYNNVCYIGLSTNQGYLYINYVREIELYKSNYYIQRYEGTWKPILIGQNKPSVINQRAFYVNNDFNLIKIFVYPNNLRNATWYFPIVKEIFNPTQYNGQPYEGKDSLSPLLTNLYSNGSVVFSRNLYNISKQNNTTMSSVEIPNTYLNDLTITQNDLISETNLQMNSDIQSWTKNIYEVVDLNFLNTISVIDEDTSTQYLASAVKVNNATTDGGSTNYQNTPCNKYRINYTDATTSIKPLYWSAIDNTHKETMISFYVDKAISSIDFISNDETTIYLNIPVEVEVGNYYSLSEKIRIGV